MSTIPIFGCLDDAIKDVATALREIPSGEKVTIEIRSEGGSLGAVNTLFHLFKKAKEKKHLAYRVEPINARSAGLILFLCFEKEERHVTKKSEGYLHLPNQTHSESDAVEQVISFFVKKTSMSRAEVIYHNERTLFASDFIKYEMV